jgi:uncharacterized integral membrane protein (TIGR02327 family)
MVKLVLYCLSIPISMWALECLRMEHIFKKGREMQIKILYVMMSFALSYLVTNFLYDVALHSSSWF